jgi:hypothetical protein
LNPFAPNERHTGWNAPIIGANVLKLSWTLQEETAHMPRFLIEVPHESGTVACARANKVLLESGSHFLTHADFGCTDGVHKAWIVVDVDSKDEARRLLPPAYRSQAMIVRLNKFGLAELDDLIKRHEGG